MYRRRRFRKLKLRINRKISAVLTATLAFLLCIAMLFRAFWWKPEKLDRFIQKEFSEYFEQMTAESLENLSNDGQPDPADLAELKNQVLGNLRKRFKSPAVLFTDHSIFPLIVDADADIQGYFTQKILHPAGNIGVFSLKFTAVARFSRNNELVCEAECLVYQEIVKGSASYQVGNDLFE